MMNRGKSWLLERMKPLLRQTYARMPHVLMLAMRPFLHSRPHSESAFLARFAIAYEHAVYSMGRRHWEDKVLKFELTNKEAVLDLGCGPGQWLPILAQYNREVVGIDVETQMLETARKTVAGVSNVSLAQMTAEELCFQTESFDAVLCYTVLMYTDQERVIKEIRRVLKPGGKLILGLMGAGYYLKHIVEGIKFRDVNGVRYGLDPFVGQLVKIFSHRHSNAITYWTKGQIKRLLRKSEFEIARIFAERKADDWPDKYLGSYFYFCVEASGAKQKNQAQPG